MTSDPRRSRSGVFSENGVVAVGAGARQAGTTFGASFIRRPGGRYVVAMTVEQWCDMWREATS